MELVHEHEERLLFGYHLMYMWLCNLTVKCIELHCILEWQPDINLLQMFQMNGSNVGRTDRVGLRHTPVTCMKEIFESTA